MITEKQFKENATPTTTNDITKPLKDNKMENKKMIADSLIDGLLEYFKKAKELEKEIQREKMIALLDWMNKVSATNPMALETDNDDIVDMFLKGYYE